MNSPESPPWGFLQWAIAGLASIGASAAAFVWRLITRLQTLKLRFDNTNLILTCHNRRMNLRSCVLLNVWRCCTMITIVYERRLAAFPVAAIFTIWSFAWGSGWIRWPCVSTALSTHIFHDEVDLKWTRFLGPRVKLETGGSV